MRCSDRPVFVEQGSTTLVQERVLLPLPQRDHPRVLAEIGLGTADYPALRHVQSLSADRLDIYRCLDGGRCCVTIYKAALARNRRYGRGAGGRGGRIVDDGDPMRGAVAGWRHFGQPFGRELGQGAVRGLV